MRLIGELGRDKGTGFRAEVKRKAVIADMLRGSGCPYLVLSTEYSIPAARRARSPQQDAEVKQAANQHQER